MPEPTQPHIIIGDARTADVPGGPAWAGILTDVQSGQTWETGYDYATRTGALRWCAETWLAGQANGTWDGTVLSVLGRDVTCAGVAHG